MRDYVVVAGQDQRLFELEPFIDVANESVHPSDLIGIFLSIGRISVRQIDRSHADDAVSDGDDRFDEAGMIVLHRRQVAAE